MRNQKERAGKAEGSAPFYDEKERDPLGVSNNVLIMYFVRAFYESMPIVKM